MLNKGARGVQAKETVAFVGAWTLFCGPAAGVPNLYMVESVDSLKVANHLDHAVSGLGRQPLRVLVQVNTSGEKCSPPNLTPLLLSVQVPVK
jgi:hypothetical protein